jgi:hypothetical protein
MKEYVVYCFEDEQMFFSVYEESHKTKSEAIKAGKMLFHIYPYVKIVKQESDKDNIEIWQEDVMQFLNNKYECKRLDKVLASELPQGEKILGDGCGDIGCDGRRNHRR